MNSDEIRWSIMHASAKWTNVRLAADYGISAATVSRYRRQPWTCPVAFVPCRWCGETVTQSTSSAHGNRRWYHPECRPNQLRKWSRDAQRKRFESLNGWQRRWELDDLAKASQEIAKRRYEQTTPAPRNRAAWNANDDAWLVANYRFDRIVEVAQHLGRTTNAVRRRFDKLTK